MMNYKIAIFSNSTKILEQELGVGTYILGRSQTSDIKLDIPEVSRKHLEIIVDENGIILTNLSSHGSFWNKKIIQPGFCLQPDMEIFLGKNTILKNVSEICDSDETNIASAIPAVMQFLKATKKCDANESDSEELFFEEVNQIDSTFATDVMKTRIANVDELRQLRIQDSRKKSIKLGLIFLGLVSVIALLIVLYSINFTTVENTLTWPCDKNGQFLGNFIDSQIGSFTTGQFSLSVPFINGISSVVKENDRIIVHTRFGKNGDVPLRIIVLRERNCHNIRKSLKDLFIETLSKEQKKDKQMTYSALSDLFYMGNDNGIPCYGADYTKKDDQGLSWAGYAIAFRNGQDLFVRFAEVPLSEKSRAFESISAIPFLKFSPTFVETVWDGAETIISGETEDLLSEINKHLSKQAPFEWQRTYLLITTVLTHAQTQDNLILEKPALDLLRILRRQQKKWYNSQKRNFFQAELERKDTRNVIELCKTVFSSPKDLRYQMLRRNRWE